MVRRNAVLLAGLTSVLLILAGCSESASAPQHSASPQAVVTSPSPDPVTQTYVALVHNYWIQYKTAEGDIPHFAQVCGYSGAHSTEPSACRDIAAAILPPHEKFLNGLDATPAPPQFAADDQAFRTQLPMAIAHLKAMMVAAAGGKKQVVSDEMRAYVGAMVPIVTLALDHVDPSVVHT